MSATETPRESGLRGAAIRWGNPANRKRVRMDALSPEERALVLALIAAKEAAVKAEGSS